MKFKLNQRRLSCCIMLLQRWHFKPGWSLMHPVIFLRRLPVPLINPFTFHLSLSGHHCIVLELPVSAYLFPIRLCLLKSENCFLLISSQPPAPNPHDKAHHPLHSRLKCVMPGLIKIPFPHLCAKNINAGRPASLSSEGDCCRMTKIKHLKLLPVFLD